ncbi:amidohydrolase [Hyphomicrobium nitrativorans NL23]|uniref:Amidohydrolase n=1 Tax=Hyphomicrobium nitrativorans NL23 TaxID=1029756 RepID=V5S9T9_9HYPH|nr:amidohydrolase family protein [Hyphomicrobium nitrativorans]AHB47388.1 amidohydrolase [Hyphomicrobium nitrativorans NL23]
MKRLAALAILVLSTPGWAETVAITGVRLVDGTGAAPVENAAIVVRDGRIVSAGSNAEIPADARRIVHSGRTVIPGLVSAHSHVGQVGGTSMGAKNYTREVISAELAQFGRYGVTTVVALGNNGPLFTSLRDEAHAGSLDGADLFGVMQGIGVPNGAPPQDSLKVAPNQLFRPHTADDARTAIDRMAAANTDLVKLWLDNFGGLLPVKMKPEIYRAVIEQSHEHGLKVAAHVHDLDDAIAIVDAGADIVAHGIRDKPVTPELIEKMKAKGVWYVPTLALDDATFVWAEAPAWTETDFVRKALSPEFAAQIDDPAWREKVLKEPRTAAARRSLAMNLQNLKTLHEAGVKIGFGTDSGATPLRVPGVAEHRELALMAEAGLSPAAALTIATKNAAELMGLEDRGTIQAGKRADLVVLDGDPTEDIAASERIVEVWTAGRKAIAPEIRAD